MNWIERQAIKLAWGRMKGMAGLRRWLPLIGVAIVALGVILRALGLGDAAAFVEELGGLTGLSKNSPVGVSELAGAVAAAVGVFLKLRSEYQKAQASKIDFVTPPKG